MNHFCSTIGNIISAGDNTHITTCTYDSMHQLIRENNRTAGRTWTWEYDHVGNIISRTEYAYTTGDVSALGLLDTVQYTYGNSTWGDLLTAYDGVTLTYDTVGNLTNDGTWTYTWEQGRQLASMAKTGTTWSFSYDADGMRTKRTNGTTTYEYIYTGSQLTRMTVGSNTLYFTYDASGVPLGVTYNGTHYYYVTNLQGDITAIHAASGTVEDDEAVVTYVYDAWGNIHSTGGTMATTLGVHNPLRYRGYVYDTESKLYYLQSRYYDPEIGRFINADDPSLIGANGDSTSCNLYTYCGNNPIVRMDDKGQWWTLVIGAAVGVGTQALADFATGSISSPVDYLSAAVSGALAASGIGTVTSVIANAALGGATYLLNCNVNNKQANGFDLTLSVLIGGISGVIGGSGANGTKLNGIYQTSKSILETAVFPKKIAMYTTKIANVIDTVIESTIRTITAGLTSNAGNLIRKDLTGSAY